MAPVACTNHPDVGAIGKCSRCEKPYCLDCLDIDSGKPLCQNCISGKSAPAASSAPAVPEPPPVFTPPIPRVSVPTGPLVIKRQGDTLISLDDLDLGKKAPEEVQAQETPAPSMAEETQPEAAPMMSAVEETPEPIQVIPEETPIVEAPVFNAIEETQPVPIVQEDLPPAAAPVFKPFEEKPEPVMVKPDLPPVAPASAAKPPDHDPLGLFKAGSAPPAFTMPTAPVSIPAATAPTPAAAKPVDNDPLGLFKAGAPPAFTMPETPKPVSKPIVDLPPMPKPDAKPFESSVPFSDKSANVPSFNLPGMTSKTDAVPKSGSKVSIKDLHAPPNDFVYKLRSFVGALWLKVDIFAAKFKMPGYLLAAIVFVLLAGGITVYSQLNSSSSVALVDSIQPIHIISLDVSQVPDMDITAYSDLQNHLGPLGFTQAIQMTIPQIPAPNFFDVGFKDDGTYCEILKIPNQIGPRVSFVTVFTNGIWYSTNGWVGTNQQSDYLLSEFFPNQTPEQLYAQHQQGVQKLQTDNDWQVQKPSLNRYMAALSDRIRWFLTTSNVLPYKADFASWH
jgi:hypothetical protein